MNIYFGSKGNKFFIMCRDLKECYAFNRFGTLEAKEGLVSSCSNWVEVDFISFVERSNDSCELLFNSEKAVINKDINACVSEVRKFRKHLGTIFTIPHKDDIGMFTQIFFVTRKGEIRKSILEQTFGIDGWINL